MTISPALEEAARRFAAGQIADLEALKAELLKEIDARVDARIAQFVGGMAERGTYND